MCCLIYSVNGNGEPVESLSNNSWFASYVHVKHGSLGSMNIEFKGIEKGEVNSLKVFFLRLPRSMSGEEKQTLRSNGDAPLRGTRHPYQKVYFTNTLYRTIIEQL